MKLRNTAVGLALGVGVALLVGIQASAQIKKVKRLKIRDAKGKVVSHAYSAGEQYARGVLDIAGRRVWFELEDGLLYFGDGLYFLEPGCDGPPRMDPELHKVAEYDYQLWVPDPASDATHVEFDGGSRWNSGSCEDYPGAVSEGPSRPAVLWVDLRKKFTPPFQIK